MGRQLNGMQTLALAAAAFAVVALAAGQIGGLPGTAGLVVVGALLALALWRSGAMSSFLKIFAAIFAVEYVAFGLVTLAARGGAWPAALGGLVPPASLPVTVGIFGLLVVAISHIPVIRTITAIADRFFESGDTTAARLGPLRWSGLERRLAKGFVVFLVLVNQAQVAINVRLSFFNRDWFNAIQERNEPQFWSLLYTVFLFWAAVYILSAIVEYVVESFLTIRWRRWLTNDYVARWLGESTHYRMGFSGGADNPDQRIAEDVYQFIVRTYSFSLRLLSQVSTLVSFSIVLWGISTDFTLPGTDIVVPGLLFWIALIYSAFGTFVTHMIGRPLIRLNFEQQRYEADFRFSLARLREYAEQIALLAGEPTERRLTMGRFGEVIANFLRIVDRRKRLMAFTAAYGQMSPIIPYVIAAPFYFAGKVQLGTMTQTAGAFARVEGALSFFIDSYVTLADYKAVVDRLSTFDQSIARGRSLGQAEPRIAMASHAGETVAVRDLVLSLPDGRAIVAASDLALKPRERVLVTGPSGSGKSTLFRALAGIWPFGQGLILTPEGKTMMLLPQRPYIPIGTLRGAVTYPAAAGSFEEADIHAALAAVRLPHLQDSLDAEDAWTQRLSGGEQQRLAVARALLARPDWLFLDEATAALDEPTEAEIYRVIAERLPETTVVSIGHRSTLIAFHDRRIDMRPTERGPFQPTDLRTPAPVG